MVDNHATYEISTRSLNQFDNMRGNQKIEIYD